MNQQRTPAPWLVSGFITVVVLALGSMPYLENISAALAQQGHAHSLNSGPPNDTFARELSAAMDKMHKDMMYPTQTGDADRDFLATMIPHHQGAVEMARLVLIHGNDPLVRRLAEEIIAGQQSEIEAMRARLQILSNGADPSPGGYPSLGSTRQVGQ